jgi:hypothetical protein
MNLRRFLSRRVLIIAVGALIVLGVAGRILAQPAGPKEVAIDTSGASAGAASGTPAAGAGRVGTPLAGTPTAPSQAKPTAPASTPVVVQVEGTAVSVEPKPIILLNPSSVRQGSTIGVSGSGFDAGATIDLTLKQGEGDEGTPLTFVQLDRSGGFGGVSFNAPNTLAGGNFIVEARQRNSDKVARAVGVVAGGAAQVKLGTQVGKAGDVIELSAQGFAPDEEIKVYLNNVGGTSIATLRSGPDGGIKAGSVRVPFGAVGSNALIFVGEKSQSPVSFPFLLLNLFPSVELSSYAIKPDNVLSFNAKDFGPEERVAIYLNSPDGPPLTTVQADSNGTFTNAGGFVVPFGLAGRQTLIFVGQQSKAPATASFDILPYTPNAQPSTYGGRPGTAVTFYGAGFAKDEIVNVYIGRTQDSPGQMVSCFRTDDRGNVGAGGSYIIPGDAQAGQLIFSLTGKKSQAVATAAVEIMASDVPVQVPPQPEFKCTLDADGAPSAGQTTVPAGDRASPNAKPAAPAPAPAAPAAQRVQTTPVPGTPAPQTAPATPVPTAPATQPAPATPSPTAPTDQPTPALPGQ